MLNIDVISNHLKAGSLSFDHKALERYTHLTPANIFITRDKRLERDRVENFIHDVFYKTYGAEIDSYYPTLMSVHDIKNNIFAAVGYRFAGEESLFLEQYLSTPVEDVAKGVFNKNIDRTSIVEVGNLAATGAGASIFLFVALTAYLKQQGYGYVVFTGTKSLHAHFRMLGLKPQLIGSAKPDALSDATKWGTYYDTDPRILIADIAQSYEHLHKILMVDYTGIANKLAPRIHPSFRGSK